MASKEFPVPNLKDNLADKYNIILRFLKQGNMCVSTFDILRCRLFFFPIHHTLRFCEYFQVWMTNFEDFSTGLDHQFPRRLTKTKTAKHRKIFWKPSREFNLQNVKCKNFKHRQQDLTIKQKNSQFIHKTQAPHNDHSNENKFMQKLKDMQNQNFVCFEQTKERIKCHQKVQKSSQKFN